MYCVPLLISRTIIRARSIKWQCTSSIAPTIACYSKYRSINSSAQRYTVNTKLLDHGKSLIVKLDGEDTEYHPTWLRHNCQCPSCVASSGQKTINFSELDTSNIIKSVQLSGGRLSLSWSSGHNGYINIGWLKKKRKVFQKRRHHATPKTASEIPTMSGVGLTEDKEKLWRWLQLLNEYGVCLLTDMGQAVDTVKELAGTMFNAQLTIYGESSDIKHRDDTVDLTYSNHELPLHMDLAYYESIPGLQILHCLKFDDCIEGGESVLLDMLPVVEELRKKWPEQFHTLTRVPATFQTGFEIDKEAVQMTSKRPHIQLDRFGEVALMSWCPITEGSLDVPKEDIEPYYKAYHRLAEMLNNSELKLIHRLRPGEVITFNNRRILHSRKLFALNGGERYLKNVFVNIDHFKSTFMTLCEELGKTECEIRRVFALNEF